MYKIYIVFEGKKKNERLFEMINSFNLKKIANESFEKEFNFLINKKFEKVMELKAIALVIIEEKAHHDFKIIKSKLFTKEGEFYV